MNDESTSLVIYHGGCTDGVAAAWAVWRAHPDWRFYPGVYQQEPPWDRIDSAPQVFLVDFSYKRPVMEEIARRCAGTVTVLDHHKTAREDLEDLLHRGVIYGQFDMDRCGAMLAWGWFFTSERPELLRYIDARDRWVENHGLVALDEAIMALRSYPHEAEPDDWASLMRHWSRLMAPGGVEALINEGGAILRYYRARVEDCKRLARAVDMLGLRAVPLVNCPWNFVSDVAGELAAEAPHGVAACWWQKSDGSIEFSLRSRGDVDVGELAAKLGGGGHPGAAGFRLGREAGINLANPLTQYY